MCARYTCRVGSKTVSRLRSSRRQPRDHAASTVDLIVFFFFYRARPKKPSSPRPVAGSGRGVATTDVTRCGRRRRVEAVNCESRGAEAVPTHADARAFEWPRVEPRKNIDETCARGTRTACSAKQRR